MDNMESITQQFISLVRPLVGGRAIFVADQDAVITASSDPGLVGRRHEGARLAILSSQTVRISQHDLPQYPGSGEGVVLPISTPDWRGAVGICGMPAEVEELGNLLRLCLTQQFEHSALAGSQLYQDYRQRLLKLLIYGECPEQELRRLCTLLDVQLQFPMRALVLSSGGRSMIKDGSLAALLIDRGFINPRRDVYGVEGDRFVLLRYAPPSLAGELPIAQQLYDLVRDHFMVEPALARGGECANCSELSASYREANWLSRLGQGYRDMSDRAQQVRYLLGGMDPDLCERFIGPIYRDMRNQFIGEFEDIISSIDLYCTGESLAVVAGQLHIHKNTLIYRIKKASSIAGVNKESSFVKEFFLRLLVQSHRQHTRKR